MDLRTPEIGLEWERWPASSLLFAAISLLVMVYALTLDRTYLTDQSNYIAYFSEAPSLDWLQSFSGHGSFLKVAVIGLFSEELLWHVWTTVFGYLMDPDTAVLLLVGVLNALILLSVERLPNPTLGVLLWMVVPVGLADVGLLQLRQGFALAVMLFLALRMRRPVLGALIAAMIHTTFAIAFIFAVISWMLRRRPLAALAGAVVIAFAGAYGGRLLFEMFAGRRLLEYSVSQGATSLNYVFGGLAAMVPSIYWMITSPAAAGESDRERVISSLALTHIGFTAFTIFSFFLFPIGTGRVGYMSQLLLIPILPSLNMRSSRALNLGVTALTAVYLVYLVSRSYLMGAYQVYF